MRGIVLMGQRPSFFSKKNTPLQASNSLGWPGPTTWLCFHRKSMRSSCVFSWQIQLGLEYEKQLYINKSNGKTTSHTKKTSGLKTIYFRDVIVITWNPNDPCFDWTLGLLLEGFCSPKKSGQLQVPGDTNPDPSRFFAGLMVPIPSEKKDCRVNPFLRATPAPAPLAPPATKTRARTKTRNKHPTFQVTLCWHLGFSFLEDRGTLCQRQVLCWCNSSPAKTKDFNLAVVEPLRPQKKEH